MFDGFSEETVPGDGANIFVRHASHGNGARPGIAKSLTDPTLEVAHSATDTNRPANGYGVLPQNKTGRQNWQPVGMYRFFDGAWLREA